MKMFRAARWLDDSYSCVYLIEYAPKMHCLGIFVTPSGEIECSFITRCESDIPAGSLELLVNTGISKGRIERVVHGLQHTMISISAMSIGEFLRGQTDEVKDYNNGKPWSCTDTSTIAW